jgi:hypothetical protein
MHAVRHAKVGRKLWWGVDRSASPGQAPTDRRALEPYWGKPATRNLRGDDGNVGIIRSPLRAIVLPDPMAMISTCAFVLRQYRFLQHWQVSAGLQGFTHHQASGHLSSGGWSLGRIGRLRLAIVCYLFVCKEVDAKIRTRSD